MSGVDSAILTWHSLDTTGSPISTPPALFRRQMEMLSRSGVRVAPLAEIRESRGAVALTFDDGFRNFFDYAAGVLAEFRFPATVFVVSGHCGKYNDWPSQPRGIPKFPLMDWSELRELVQAGIALGAHTAGHPCLTALPPEEVARELRDCRRELEDRTGQPADAFAYPYGASNTVVRGLAGREFRLACGTDLRFVHSRSDPLNLPRLDVCYLRNPLVFANLQAMPGRSYITLRRWLRVWGKYAGRLA